MNYRDVEKAMSLKRAIDELDDLKFNILDIINETSFLDNRDFDSVFNKIKVLKDNKMKELEDL